MENEKPPEPGSGNTLIENDKVVFDSMGNEIKVDASKSMDKKTLKKKIKSLQRELKAAKKSKDQDMIDELNYQIEDLKEEMSKIE